jgi:cephalosporin-C deacetylase-like acetyl esterase
MNSMITRRLHRNLLLCFYLLGSISSMYAQLTVTTDRPTANYSVGTTANFIISSNASGAATYKLYYDNKTTPITTGNLAIAAGQPLSLPYRHTEPGVVLCAVTQNGVTKMSSVAFSPMEITPAEAEPTDFDAFWNSQKNLINSVPLAPEVTFYRRGYGFVTYKLSLGNIDGRRVYGYISVPESTPFSPVTGPLPAIISLPSYGDAPGVCSPEEMIPQQGRAICVSLSVHNADPETKDPNAYKPNIITDKQGFYYRYALLGVVQTINYLFTQPNTLFNFNKTDIGIVGTSQGAGLALCAAGLDNRIKLVAISNPALCEHSAFKIGKASGFPNYLNQARIANTEALASVAVKYYDAIYFAKRFKGVTYAVVGYQDDVTPAATTFAALAQLRQKTLVFHAPQMGHAHPEEYWTGRLAFFKKYFSTMTNATQSHAAAAGADQSTELAQPVALTGSVALNNLVDSAMSVRWEKVSGTGTVTFSDAFNRKTQARFSAVGTYTLRFSATDNRFLNGKVYVAMDYVTITVTDNIKTTAYCEAKGNQPWHNWIERIENETAYYGSFKECYADFTNKVFRAQQGKTTVFELTPGYAWQMYPVNWRIWVDFNGNKDFSDAGEMVVSATDVGRFKVNIPIPANAPLGNARIRIAMQRDSFPNPCGLYEFGEVEDYTLNISESNGAPLPPSYGSSNGTNYCTGGGIASNVWISSVRFGDSTYNSSKDGYGNFIGKNFTIAKSQAVPLALKPSFAGAPADIFWKVWMDYDRDGHFALTENIWSSQGKDLVNTLMFMPSNLVSGIPYRMRVVMRQGGEPFGYCGIVDVGEIEDYTVFLTDAVALRPANYVLFKEQIQLYPNPVSEELTIDLNAYGGGKGGLRIYDSFGKMVWAMPEETFSSRQIKLDVTNFQDGIYFLMTEGAGLRILLDKFVVLKQR